MLIIWAMFLFYKVPPPLFFLVTPLKIIVLKAREEEMTAKVMDLQTQLEELQKKYQQKLQQEESPSSDHVRGI